MLGRRLQYAVERYGGLLSAVRHWFVGKLYRRQIITIMPLDEAIARRPMVEGIECLAIDSVSALHTIASEIPATFRDSLDELKESVASGCVLCVARQSRANGDGTEIIGYEIAEQGVFSALGRRIRISQDVVFSHWAEVLPEHRGRRVHNALFAKRDEYFRSRGCTMVCGVCRPDNQASLNAQRRMGWYIAGNVERALLGLWRTPDRAVHRIFEKGHPRWKIGAQQKTLEKPNSIALRAPKIHADK